MKMNYKPILTGACLGAGIWLTGLSGIVNKSTSVVPDRNIQTIVKPDVVQKQMIEEDISKSSYLNGTEIIRDYQMGLISMGDATNYMNTLANDRLDLVDKLESFQNDVYNAQQIIRDNTEYTKSTSDLLKETFDDFGIYH